MGNENREDFEKNTFIPEFIELKNGKYAVKNGQTSCMYDYAAILNKSFISWQAAKKQAEQEWLNIDFIDSQLKEKGMLTLTQLLESYPSPFMLHAGVDDFDTFCQWVELRYKETTKLKALQLAKKGESIIEDDNLYDWSCAMANAYQEMYQQWKVVESNAKSQIESLKEESEQLDTVNTMLGTDVQYLRGSIDKLCDEIDHLKSQLNNIPEGCTPTDAKKLREFNHGLAEENAGLQKEIITLKNQNEIRKGLSDAKGRDIIAISELNRDLGEEIEKLESTAEETRISQLQYESLRKNFSKMIDDVLGSDYYNMAMDVYDSDRVCCEDITYKANQSLLGRFFYRLFYR